MGNTYTKLTNDVSSFEEMMEAFGVVTVMNAKIYEIDDAFPFESNTAKDILDHYAGREELAHIDTLKMANITIDGPTKTVTGGQYSNPLLKFGKTARIEMQDALGRAKAIEAFGGSVNEYGDSGFTKVEAIHITEDFAPVRLMIGDSFFISRKTGQQVKVNIIFYQILPDSIFNLNQDSEGDATVFDMNADLLTTNIKLPTTTVSESTVHGVFYSILQPSTVTSKYTINTSTLAVTGKESSDVVKYSTDGGTTWDTSVPSVDTGDYVHVRIISDKGQILFEKVVVKTVA